MTKSLVFIVFSLISCETLYNPTGRACQCDSSQVWNPSTKKCTTDKFMLTRQCMQVYIPVCGCDDVTYPNLCAAEQAGIKWTKKGECSDVIQMDKVEGIPNYETSSK